jgi:hypothetical protein
MPAGEKTTLVSILALDLFVQHARQSNHSKTLSPPSGHSTPVDRLSPQVITKLLYLLSQGETFSKVGICCRTFRLAMHNLRISLLTLLYTCILDRKSSRRSSSASRSCSRTRT